MPRIAGLARQLTTILSPRSVAGRLYTLTAIALAVIVLLGSMALLAFERITGSSQQVMVMFEQAQRADNLYRRTIHLSADLVEVIETDNQALIPQILAGNETLLSDFSAYQSVAEEHNLKSDATFIVENKSLILAIRENVYQALNLYRSGASDEAALAQARVDRDIQHLATAIERSSTQRQVALDNESQLLSDTQQQQAWLMATIFALGAVVLFGVSLGYSRAIVTSLNSLIASTDEIAAGNYKHRIRTRSIDEFARLALSFNQMSSNVEKRQEQVVQQQQTIEQRAIELERTLTDLRQATDERDQLNDAIRELSSPVLPISGDILVMPLIGAVDSERAAIITQSLLQAIERHRARIAILDVTGVPIIDTQVARVLLQAAEAAKLLGTQTLLTGIRPELAQTIVGLGVNLSGVVTHTDLQSSITYALRQRRSSERALAGAL